MSNFTEDDKKKHCRENFGEKGKKKNSFQNNSFLESNKFNSSMSVASEQNEERENVNEWVRFGLKLAVQSALHPLEYSKVLIQVKNIFCCIKIMK